MYKCTVCSYVNFLRDWKALVISLRVQVVAEVKVCQSDDMTTSTNELPLQVPASVQDILYLTAVLNTCINPFIYGVYYYSENSNPRPSRGSCYG